MKPNSSSSKTISLVIVTTCIISATFLIGSISRLYMDVDRNLAYFNLALSFLLIANLGLWYQHKNDFITKNLSILFTLAGILAIFFFSERTISNTYGVVIFPLVVFLLSKRAEQTFWLFMNYGAIFFAIVVDITGKYPLSYDSNQYIFILIYMTITVAFTMVYDQAMNKKQEELSEANRSLDENNTRIEQTTSQLEKKLTELEDEKNINENNRLAILNVMDDVRTEKIRAEDERKRLNVILQSIGDGVFVLNRNKEIILANTTTQKITGYSEKELIGRKYTETMTFINEKTGEPANSFIEDVYQSNQQQSMDGNTLLKLKDGSLLPVADSSAPILDEEGKLTGCVVIFRDYSKEREIDRMKSEFVSVASHQLRTPLTSIKWYIELMLEESKSKQNLDQSYVQTIEKIDDSNERMIQLVNDLLSVSRIETGKKFSIEKQRTDIVKTIEKVISDQQMIVDQKNVHIEKAPGYPDDYTILVDPNKIYDVFFNLINNAIKYSPQGKSIFISIVDKHPEVEITVKDEGMGIPQEAQSKIFSKFFRAENAVAKETQGNGLGLYIVKSIIEAHNGNINFKSEENKGTTFRVVLPKLV